MLAINDGATTEWLGRTLTSNQNLRKFRDINHVRKSSIIILTDDGNSPPTAKALLFKKGLISSNSAVTNRANDKTNKKYLNILQF